MRRRLMGCSENVTFVKSLISHGMEYIDTGIAPNSDTLVEMSFYIEKFNYEFENYFGAPENMFGLIRHRLTNELLVLNKQEKDLSYKESCLPPIKVDFKFDSLNNNYTLNGTTKTFNNVEFAYPPNSFWIFTKKSKDGNKPDVPGKFKLYSFSITTSSTGEKKIDLVPALDNNNVPCLYDKVSKSFFYNKGSGTFGYETFDGNVINP